MVARWSLLILILAAAAAVGQGRRLLVDSEGAPLAGMPAYLAYVATGCGDPAKAQGDCAKLKESFCGAKENSAVLCLGGSDATAQFRSASSYTRVGYLRCSLNDAVCKTDRESWDRDAPAATVDPKSLAAWYEYQIKCSSSATVKTAAATCFNLSGQLCSRPDVKCSKNDAEFYDVSDLKAKRVVLRSDDERGLVFLVAPTMAAAAAAVKKP